MSGTSSSHSSSSLTSLTRLGRLEGVSQLLTCNNCRHVSISIYQSREVFVAHLVVQYLPPSPGRPVVQLHDALVQYDDQAGSLVDKPALPLDTQVAPHVLVVESWLDDHLAAVEAVLQEGEAFLKAVGDGPEVERAVLE